MTVESLHFLPVGSSPRVRSRHRERSRLVHPTGIISACAEQTKAVRSSQRGFEDHLRVCGADSDVDGNGVPLHGSSPRVRSRRSRRSALVVSPGIISACAEQTLGGCSACRSGRDHLRVCGADTIDGLPLGTLTGSSPRVRSRRCFPPCVGFLNGIISACAEQTNIAAFPVRDNRDHLRVCGADFCRPSRTSGIWGSSPRVRSRQRQ